MQHQHLLFEIGTEELPAHGLAALGEQLLANIEALLDKHTLSYDKSASAWFATPRRLSVFISHCTAQQPEQCVTRKGPKIGFEGAINPTAAGFAKSCGVTIDALRQDGEYYAFTQITPGKSTLRLLPELLNKALSDLSIARPMRWGDHDTGFIRPVKWILALFGADIIDVTCFGIKADRLSYGHRFMAPDAISFDCADQANYEQYLYDAKVIASFTKRQETINQQLAQKITLESLILTPLIEPALLTEVTGLVEWPVALAIPFDPRFLKLPSEALIASMQNHQKCFAIEDQQGQLQAAFITISNIESFEPDNVIQGNARVMHARLSDGEFFYDFDMKTPLANYQPMLAKMTFQHHLGSMHNKVEALVRLTTFIAAQCGADEQLAKQAATLAKSDLCTQMVNEFPELQGIMGCTYALQQGINSEVASALFEQYLPKFAGDALPKSPLGTSLALADRLLNLTGIFGVGLVPTGDKDPFALRRAALGVIRIILDQKHVLALLPLIHESVASWQDKLTISETADQVFDFILERLRNYWLNHDDFSAHSRDDVIKAIEAVLSNKSTLKEGNLHDCRARLKALLTFQSSAAAIVLASANKRVNNLLKKENLDTTTELPIQAALFEQPAEHALYTALTTSQMTLPALLAQADYIQVLQHLALLKDPIDAFFADVMVLVDDQKLRHNRLALLAQLKNILGTVADLSCL